MTSFGSRGFFGGGRTCIGGPPTRMAGGVHKDMSGHRAAGQSEAARRESTLDLPMGLFAISMTHTLAPTPGHRLGLTQITFHSGRNTRIPRNPRILAQPRRDLQHSVPRRTTLLRHMRAAIDARL